MGNAAHGKPLTEQQAARLSALRLAHLRVELDLSSPELAARLTQAWQDAQAIGAELEAALFVSAEAARELQAFQTLLTRVKPGVARWLVFPTLEHMPGAGWLELVRSFLAAYDATIPLYGGTNGYFTELNRARPPLAALDGVTYSVNPQVHAVDLRSVSECPPATGTTISSARAFCADKPLAISPITLRPRFNPHIVGPQPAPPPGELPSAVDPRQMSLFGAGWTLGALKAVTEAGLNSVTFYETTGWRGVMETDADSPVPEKFFSRANMVFPLYHVFADVAELADRVALGTVSTHPLQIQTLALRAGTQTRLLLCNLTNENQTARIPAISAKEAALQRLNEFTFESATMQPEEFRARPPERVAVSNGKIALTLLPFEIVRVDWKNNS